MKKALILFSGGLDSRLAAKIIEEQGFQIELVFIKLPFGGGCCSDLPCVINFAQTSGYKLHILDATKDERYDCYIELVEKPKHGRGKAMNPCKDCKIFIFKEGEKLRKEIEADILVTGEVIGQRPMSQIKKALLFDDEKADLVGKILRPLSAKLLPETDYEKEGLVDRNKLLGIEGRRREEQMRLAETYKIKYPTPAGGCLLCEKIYSQKLKALMKYSSKLKYEEILLLNKGRMFKDKGLIFIGRNKEENFFIREIAKKLNWNSFLNEDIPGPTIVYDKKEDEELVKNLWEAYRKDDLKERKKFEELKIK